MVSNGEIVSEEGESAVSASGSPLLDVSIGGSLESAEERDEHVPVERVPDEACTASIRIRKRVRFGEGRRGVSTNGGVGASAEEVKGVELGEIAVAGLPAPRGEGCGVGFVGAEAVPALEDLLAGVVVGGGSGGVGDPCSVGVVAGGGGWGGAVGVERGCVLGEEEEDGGEAEEREEREEREFLLRSFPCGHACCQITIRLS